jgi:uncharacterized protein
MNEVTDRLVDGNGQNPTQSKLSRRRRLAVLCLYGTPIIILVASFFGGSETKVKQELPVTAQWKLVNRSIKLEVAKTSEELTTGLKQRKNLARDRGMLFQLGYYILPSVSMYKMEVPIDIIYLSQRKVVAIQENMLPCRAGEISCTMKSSVFATEIIEVPAGIVREQKVKIGQTIKIEQL